MENKTYPLFRAHIEAISCLTDEEWKFGSGRFKSKPTGW